MATNDALASAAAGADTVPFCVYPPNGGPTSEQLDTEDDPQLSGNKTTGG